MTGPNRFRTKRRRGVRVAVGHENWASTGIAQSNRCDTQADAIIDDGQSRVSPCRPPTAVHLL